VYVFPQKRAKRCTKTHHNKRPFDPVIKACFQFVVFVYEGNVYTGKIINFKAENIYIFAMVGSLKS
jgi:hypothetical protein